MTAGSSSSLDSSLLWNSAFSITIPNCRLPFLVTRNTWEKAVRMRRGSTSSP